MATPKKSTTEAIKGGPLIPAASIGISMGNDMVRQLDRMAKDIKAEMRTLFLVKPIDAGMDDSLTEAVEKTFARLLKKWPPLFDVWADKLTDDMISKVERNSAVTLGMSLREIAEKTSLARVGVMTPRVQQIIQASTAEAANLIKTLPQQYLAQVQGAVMRSITTGRGLKDLVPQLNQMYKQNARKARNVALDQTRKAYNSLNAGRMQALGVKKFEWIHSGGGKDARPLHLELSGKVFSFEKPPYIGDMYGQKVHGLPGQLPNCKCTMRPIVEFSED